MLRGGKKSSGAGVRGGLGFGRHVACVGIADRSGQPTARKRFRVYVLLLVRSSVWGAADSIPLGWGVLVGGGGICCLASLIVIAQV